MRLNRNKIIFAWILLLTGMSGFLNVGAVMEFLIPVSHVTGNLTQTAICLAKGDGSRLVQYLLMFLAYLLGATVSGLIFKQKILSFKENPYGLFLISFGIILLIQSHISCSTRIVMFVLSFVMGGQNGMFIFYRGLLVRSTHMTGYITDAGTALATILKPEHVKDRKLALRNFLFYIFSMVIFVIGGFASALTHIYGKAKAGILTLTVSGIGYLILGLFVVVYRYKLRHRLIGDEVSIKED